MSSPSLRPTIETRVVAALVIAILVAAFGCLYVWADFTDVSFAWTIHPATTAIIIGEGYLAGALFFAHVVMSKNWNSVQAGFLPITAFTVFMLLATFLHWDKFHQGTFIFYVWLLVYVVTPLLVPFLWWRNRSKLNHAPAEHDLFFPKMLRWALIALGAAGILVAVVGFIWPAVYIALIPWKLSELTARIFSGWTVLSFATVVSLALDGRWSSTRVLLRSAFFAQALTLLTLPRIWPDLNPAHPMRAVFVGAMALALFGGLLVYVWAERRAKTAGVKR